MSKSKRIIISAIVCLVGVIGTIGVHHDINERKSAVRQQQAATFMVGYEKTMGPIETEDEALKLGKSAWLTCVYLDNDPSLEGAWTYGTNNLELSSDQAVAVIENAIPAFCPQHESLLEAGE